MDKFSGKVKKHLGRGKQLGFPTANLDIVADIEEGIYLGVIYLNTVKYESIIFIGSAVTFGEKEKTFEVYVLDFNQDLYGKEIEVNLINKIRENKMFETKEELIAQMQKDEEVAREFFRDYNINN